MKEETTGKSSKCRVCDAKIKRGSCEKKMCYDCCKESKRLCPSHQDYQKVREEEDRYIDDALHAKKKLRAFVHEETTFTDFNQTVVVWCLHDFCRNKRWNAATFAALDRAKLSDQLKEKRKRAYYEEAATATSSSTSTSTIQGGKIGRKKRYQQLKSKWNQRALQNPPL